MTEKVIIKICLGSSCYRRGNQTVLEVIKNYLRENNLEKQVDFKGQLCEGRCSEGPNLKIGSKKYSKVDISSVVKILDTYFKI